MNVHKQEENEEPAEREASCYKFSKMIMMELNLSSMLHGARAGQQGHVATQ